MHALGSSVLTASWVLFCFFSLWLPFALAWKTAIVGPVKSKTKRTVLLDEALPFHFHVNSHTSGHWLALS